jgi:hypothetical protein
MLPVTDDQPDAHARMSAAGQRFMVAQAQLNYLRNKDPAQNLWNADSMKLSGSGQKRHRPTARP